VTFRTAADVDRAAETLAAAFPRSRRLRAGARPETALLEPYTAKALTGRNALSSTE
jgi:hypothetical protein